MSSFMEVLPLHAWSPDREPFHVHERHACTGGGYWISTTLYIYVHLAVIPSQQLSSCWAPIIALQPLSPIARENCHSHSAWCMERCTPLCKNQQVLLHRPAFRELVSFLENPGKRGVQKSKHSVRLQAKERPLGRVWMTRCEKQISAPLRITKFSISPSRP